MKPVLRRLSAALLLLAASCASAQQAADQVFHNARAYTLDASQPWAEAVAVRGDKIVYVGDNAGALALAGPDTAQHDLQGRMLLPGFIDTHMHPVSGGAYARALSLDTYGSVEDWLQAIAAYDRTNPGDGLLFGYGFLATTFGPTGPTREQIDAVVADRPVLIMDEGTHGAWANSRTLQMLGITRDTPDPVPGFSYYKRDATGRPTGYLLEDTATRAMVDLNAITDEVIVDGTSHVIEQLNAYGITAIFDAGVGSYGDSLPSILRRIEDQENMTVRIVGSYRAKGPGDVATAVSRARQWRDEIKGTRYHYPMLKIMLDGTVEGRTAAMHEDYQGEPGNRGKLVYSQPQVDRMVTGAAQAELDVHIHALGERAIDQALDAIQVAREAHPDSSSRYTITHIQVLTDEALARFATLDVIAQSSPLWASYDTYGEQFVSPDQFNRFWRFNSLRKLGVKLTWGSDFPSSGAGALGMSPLLQMEIGHTRQYAGEPDAPVQPNRDERLPLAAMLRGYTIDAAYQLRMEDQLGSLQVGKKADLVILEQDLFQVPAHDIHKVRVMATYLDGKPVYQAP